MFQLDELSTKQIWYSCEVYIKKILNGIRRMKRSLKLKQIRENAHMSIAVTADCLFVESDIGNDKSSLVLRIGND